MTSTAQPDLRIGRVLKAHGIKGALRIESLTDFPDRFAVGSVLAVDGRRLTVSECEDVQGSLLVRFAEVVDRNQAEPLVGAYVTVPLTDARALPEGQYYHFQLVGLAVIDDRRATVLGTVAEVMTYPANDVLRVTAGSREVLIPMIRSVVRSIDPAGGRIVVDLPEEDRP